MNLHDTPVPIRPYSCKELIALYGISRKTLSRWLLPFEAEIGERQGHYYNVKQVTIIFDKLGQPSREE